MAEALTKELRLYLKHKNNLKMKKIIFIIIVFLLSIKGYSQTCFSGALGMPNVIWQRACSTNVSQYIVAGSYVTAGTDINVGGNANIAGNVSGTWSGGIISQSKGGTGYNSFSSALNAAGYNAAVMDTSNIMMTVYRANDSLAIHRAFINTKLSSSTAATTYYPLSGNPSGFLTSIPAQSFSSLTGKPTTLAGYGITDAYPLSGNPSGFLISVPAQSFNSLTGKPTTLSGYGITDAYPLSGNPSGFLTSEVDGNISNEIQTISRTNGTVSLSLSGGSFHLPDSSSTNEIQSISRTNGTVSLSLSGGSIHLPDSSNTNEL